MNARPSIVVPALYVLGDERTRELAAIAGLRDVSVAISAESAETLGVGVGGDTLVSPDMAKAIVTNGLHGLQATTVVVATSAPGMRAALVSRLIENLSASLSAPKSTERRCRVCVVADEQTATYLKQFGVMEQGKKKYEVEIKQGESFRYSPVPFLDLP